MAPFFTGIAGSINGQAGYGFGRRKAVSLSKFIQYYIFNSPGSLNTTTANNFGFTFSPSALVSLLTIGNGSSGQSRGPGQGPGGNGGNSGSVIVLMNSTLSSIAPGGNLPYTIGTISGGTNVGLTTGGNGGTVGVFGGYVNGLPGASGSPGLIPSLPTYSPEFASYTITGGSGGSGGGGGSQGSGSAGGGGGAGGLIITKAIPDTPLIYAAPVSPEPTATSGSPGGETGPTPQSSSRSGGGGGSGGTGYGAGGGGGGGSAENWGYYSPGGAGGNGSPGIFIIKISEFR
jgi:hypothetical protein